VLARLRDSAVNVSHLYRLIKPFRISPSFQNIFPNRQVVDPSFPPINFLKTFCQLGYLLELSPTSLSKALQLLR